MGEQPLRVEVERSGGFAGLVVRRALGTAGLPPVEAGELRRLAATADLPGLTRRLAAAPPPAPGGADRYQYAVTLHEGPQTWHVTVHEGAVPPGLAALVARVLRDDQ